MACTTPHPAPLTDLQVYDNKKRKRADCREDVHGNFVVKRPKIDVLDQSSCPDWSLPVKNVAYTPSAVTTDNAISSEDIALRGQHNFEKDIHRPVLADINISSKGINMSQASRDNKCTSTSQTMGTQENTRTASTLQHGLVKSESSRMKIESLFNLEILFKCDEARLIDQEIAKTQIALEQIRRCQLIPYPGHNGSHVMTEEISTHSGPSLTPSTGYSRPQSPAPWGVVDGPYSQHYSQWLIPDPRFDSLPIEDVSPRSGKSIHATRHSFCDRPSFSASRAHRQSTGSKLQALTTASPIQRERAGPLVIKRQSDGQLVKLVCKFCGKADSNSVQGFLNHCRIAHQKMYESHNAAAMECGLPMTANDTIPSPVVSSSSPTPSISQSPITLRMPIHPLIHQNSTYAHPLTASSKHNTTTPARPSPLASRPQNQTKLPKTETMSKGPTTSSSSQAGPFVPSVMTPHLSSFMQKHGLGGDLSQLVTFAKERCDMNQVEQLSTEDEPSTTSQPPTPAVSTGAGKHMSMAPHVSSNVHKSQPMLKARLIVPDSASSSFEPLMDGESTHGVGDGGQRYEIPLSPLANFSPSALSPHAAENPGLMTDHEDEDGDYETRSDSHSLMGDMSNERDVHQVRVRDEHGDEEMRDVHEHDESRRSRMQDKEPSSNCGTQLEHVTSSVLLESGSMGKKKRGRSSKKVSRGQMEG